MEQSGKYCGCSSGAGEKVHVHVQEQVSLRTDLMPKDRPVLWRASFGGFKYTLARGWGAMAMVLVKLL